MKPYSGVPSNPQVPQKLTPEAYLRTHHVLTYLEDAISQLLTQDNIPKTQTESSRFLADYFKSVLNETHVLFREIAYVTATPHNRLSFLKGTRNCYRHLLNSTESLTLHEIHSLLLFVCPDIPVELLQRCFLNTGLTLNQPIAFSPFLSFFQVQLFMDEFLSDAMKVYRVLQSLSNSSSDDSITPRKSNVLIPPSDGENQSDVDSRADSGVSVSSKPMYATFHSDSVDKFAFREKLKQLVTNTRTTYPVPSSAALDETFAGTEGNRVKFSQFFSLLSQNSFFSNLSRQTQFQTVELSTRKNIVVENV